MSYIGAIEFIKIEGPKIPQLAIRVETIDREGVDGEAFRSNANKVPEITVRTVQIVSSLSVANLAPDSYASLIGTYVTVIDDLGRTVYNVMVLDAKVLHTQKVEAPSPATFTYIVHGIWVLKPTT